MTTVAATPKSGAHSMDSAATGPRPNAATPAPRASQRPPPPPSQQEMRRHRQGQPAIPGVAQKVGNRKRKVSASPADKNAPPPYDLPSATTVFNHGVDVSMDEVGVDLFGASDQSFVDMIDTIDIDDMSVPMSFESGNEDPIDTSVPMSFESANEDPIEINPLKKKKWVRSANYSPQEDEALVMAWESVSLDPVIGTDQSSNTYWNHIYDHFHRNVKTPSSRSIGSLAHRWSAIQECCNRWAGCVEEIDHAPPNGATIEDWIKYCQELYKQRDPKHKTFVMAHCWSLLQHNEKWVKRNNDCYPLKKKSSTCSLGSVQGNEEDEETASPTLRSAMPANKRPPGRKQEKERVKKGGDHAVFQTAVQEMITSRKELEAEKKQDKESRWMEIKALEERKVKIEEDKLERKKMKEDCKIMFMDISRFDETQKVFVQTMRAQILVSRMGVNGSGGENSSA